MNTVVHLLNQHYQQIPENTAITLQHAGQPDHPVTFRDLIEESARYTHLLQEARIKPGEVVLLIFQHGADLIYSFWGTILSGSIPSIMPFLTEKLLPERYRADLASLISVTKPAAIITYPEFEDEVRMALKTGDSVRVVLTSAQIPKIESVDFSKLRGLQRHPEDIVLLQHSSGTTGLQKGVALSHQAVLSQLESYSKAIHFSAQDIVVSWLPLYHDMGLIAGFLMPILSTTHLVLMSPFDWVKSPVRLMKSISDYRGTLVWLPNFAYNFCATRIRDRDLAGVDLSSWRAVINCSEPMRYESHKHFLDRFAAYGFKDTTLDTCYAMAENVFGVTQGGIDGLVWIDEVDRDALQIDGVAAPAKDGSPAVHMVSAGKPIPGVEVKVVDAAGQTLPERKIGELALRSNCMLTGYYHRPDLTKKAFLDGWYLTGDLGYIANGEVFVSGRKKDMIIVGGRNIYPQDLELLAGSVQGVRPGRVVAFGVFDEDLGTESPVVVIEVDSQDADEKMRIEDEVRQTVTRGSAVALRRVQVVPSRWLIKTSSGKIARSANREKYLREFEAG
jgi:acyl-CoA synthetase (AMP-forming)/AMP-acid ligase II